MASTLHLSSVLRSPCSLAPALGNSASSCAGGSRNGVAVPRHVVCAAASGEELSGIVGLSRRELSVATLLVSTFGAVGGAMADDDEDYKRETNDVIDQVRTTLGLQKSDPEKPAAVAKLRQAGNEWVAKYRKSKKVAGKPSFSNMYSVINAISGHYVSFGATYPIPAKRMDRILDEVKDAEKALSRGR